MLPLVVRSCCARGLLQTVYPATNKQPTGLQDSIEYNTKILSGDKILSFVVENKSSRDSAPCNSSGNLAHRGLKGFYHQTNCLTTLHE